MGAMMCGEVEGSEVEAEGEAPRFFIRKKERKLGSAMVSEVVQVVVESPGGSRRIAVGPKSRKKSKAELLRGLYSSCPNWVCRKPSSIRGKIAVCG